MKPIPEPIREAEAVRAATRAARGDPHGDGRLERRRTAGLAGWLLAAVICTSAWAGETLPQVYSMVPQNLAAARTRLRQGDATLRPALDSLRAEADRALEFEPVLVTDKTRVPPSGDKHDYLSQAPYWWPDPKTPNGLPYIRHDGRHNPEADQGTDAPKWARLAAGIETLGLAYYFTGHEPYAGKAARLVRAWFLDPATRMNPNLRFAQYVPGRNEGRGAGVLEMRHLARVCDALALLAGSPAWTAADAQAFHVWLAAYFTWLTESPNGRDEAAAQNNHGSWYDVQTAHLALVLGRTGLARQLLADGLRKRLAVQVEPDGRQPLELARTKALGYCLFNLEALFALARLGDQAGADWWGFATKDGRSLSAALNYLAPYTDPALPWPKDDLLAADRSDLLPLLAEALRHHEDPAWRAYLEKFSDSPRQRAARWQLLLAK